MSQNFDRTFFNLLEDRVLLSATNELATVQMDWQGMEVTAMKNSWMLAADSGSEAERWLQDFNQGNVSGALGSVTVAEANDLGNGQYNLVTDGDIDVLMLGQALENLNGIEYYEPDLELFSAGIPTDPNFGQLWGLHNTGQSGGTVDADIDAPEAWDIFTGNGDHIVAVIDTGVDYSHPDLVDNMWVNPYEIAGDGLDNDNNGYIDDIYGYDFVNNDGDPMDGDSHGTHVAGTIGASSNNIGVIGVNPNVKIMALKFLSDAGFGSTSDAVEAVNYLTMMKQRGFNIRLSNNSWGGGGFSIALRDAIESNGDEDILFVAAAGNDSSDNDTSPTYPATYDLDNVISVASSDRYDQRSYFSNYGDETVHLYAPGSNIYSTTPGGRYSTKSGTSMASPHVAGALSLFLSANPGMSGLEAKEVLLEQVDKLPQFSDSVITGGRLNVHNMLRTIADLPGPQDPLSIFLDGDTVLENDPGATIGTLSTLDPDFGDTHTYTVSNADLEVVGDTLKLKDGVSADYETSSTIVTDITSTDADGLFITQEFVINVLDVPADISVSPTRLDATIELNKQGFATLDIGNIGEGDIDYVIRRDYTGKTSLDAGGPSYDWIDISGTGTSVNLTDDVVSEAFDIGFDFAFYGERFDRFRISANGWISLGETMHLDGSINRRLPSSSGVDNMIALFWDDLDPRRGGDIYYQTLGSDTLIVQYQDVPYFGKAASVRFTGQLIIKSDGSILYQYEKVDAPDSATVGIQKDSTQGLTLAYNETYLQNEMAVLITDLQDWLSFNKTSGTLAEGDSESIQMYLDGNEVPGIGRHETVFYVNSNDVSEPSVEVTVNLTVVENSYLVDTLVDESDGDFSAGDLSLREAIEQANLTAGRDTILFDHSVFGGGGTITLNGTELEVTSDLNIQGLAGTPINIDADGNSRVFNINNSANVDLAYLNLTGGQAYNGGAIFIDDATAVIQELNLEGNNASFKGGGVAVINNGLLTIRDSEISNNTAFTGGAVSGDDSDVTINSTMIENNVTVGDGGGIRFTGTSLRIEDSVIQGNDSSDWGGGLSIDHSDLLILRTTVTNNTAAQGGGLHLFEVGDYEIISSTIDNNEAALGAGIYLFDSTLAMINSTVSSNDASAGNGGGVYLTGGGTRLNSYSSTVAMNTAFKGGGFDIANGASLWLYNTLVAGNEAVNSDDDIRGTVDFSLSSLITDAGSSGGVVSGSNGNIVGRTATDILDPVLSDNGGLTRTHALIQSGDAVGGGNNNQLPKDTYDLDNDSDVTEKIPFDQRGEKRVAFGQVDIGAVELQNSAPTDLSLSGSVVNENALFGTTIGTVVVTDVDPVPPDSHAFTLLDDAGGRFALHISTGVLSVNDQRLLDHEADEAHRITVQVKDAAGNTFEKVFTIQVADVNERPTDLLLSNDLIEDDVVINGDLVGVVSVIDEDSVPPDSHIYSLIDDANGRFAIDASTGELTVADATQIDYNDRDRHWLRVRVNDAAGNYYIEYMRINVIFRNQPPTDLALSHNTVNEDAFNGYIFGSAIVTDGNTVPPDSHTYTLLDDAGGRFVMDRYRGDILVSNASLLNYEVDTSHQVTIEVTDFQGATYSETFTVYVVDQNETPTNLELDNNSIPEDTPNDGLVGTVIVTDEDTPDSHTFSLLDDAAGRFKIDSLTGELKVKNTNLINFENGTSHAVTVQAEDSGGNIYRKTLIVSVTDVNETPHDLIIDTDRIAENATNNKVVDTVIVSDQDVGDTHTFRLLQDGNGAFAIDSDSGVLSVADSTLLDRDTVPVITVTIEVTDSAGNMYEEDFDIHITNIIDERPTALILSGDTISEKAAFGTSIGTVSVIDPDDPDDSFVFEMTNDAHERFKIDSATGEITLNAPVLIDYDEDTSHQVIVEVRDAAGIRYSQALTIHVTDENHAPSDMTLVANVDEGAAKGTLIGRVLVIDEDGDDQHTFELVDSASGRVVIDQANGDVMVQRPESIVGSSFVIRVRATDNGGGTHTDTFVIRVNAASGQFQTVRLPDAAIQHTNFNGSAQVRFINTTGLLFDDRAADLPDFSDVTFKLVARELDGSYEKTLSEKVFSGRWTPGQARVVPFNFTNRLRAGSYQIMGVVTYKDEFNVDRELIVTEDRLNQPVTMQVDDRAHIDLTTETELLTKLPANHAAGNRLSVRLRVNVYNSGNSTLLNATTNMNIYLEDTQGNRHATPVATVNNIRIPRLDSGRYRTVMATVNMPANVPYGTFHFVAEVDSADTVIESNGHGTGETNNSSATTETLTISAPFVDLDPSIADRKGTPTYRSGRANIDIRTLKIENDGNVATARDALLNVRMQVYNASNQIVVTQVLTNQRFGNIAPGRFRNVNARLSLPILPAGNYRTVYTLEPVNFTDSNLANNVSQARFIIA